MRRFLVHEKVRFILVGGFNTTLDFLLFNFFVLALGLYAVVGNIISVTICIFASYFLNHYFVFKHEGKVEFKKLALFVFVTGISSIGIQSAIIWGFELMTRSEFGRSLFLVDELAKNNALEVNVAKVVAVGVGMVWNFLLYKYVVFKRPNSHIDPENILV